MDTGAVIALVVAGLALLTLVVLIGRKSRQRRIDSKRVEAHDVRREARIQSAQAERDRAEADVSAAQARREQAVAQEKATRAERSRRFAREGHERADELDPDVQERGR